MLIFYLWIRSDKAHLNSACHVTQPNDTQHINISIMTISLLRSECFNEAYFAERRLCSVLCFRMSNRLQSLIDFVTWALSDPRAYQGINLPGDATYCIL